MLSYDWLSFFLFISLPVFVATSFAASALSRRRYGQAFEDSRDALRFSFIASLPGLLLCAELLVRRVLYSVVGTPLQDFHTYWSTSLAFIWILVGPLCMLATVALRPERSPGYYWFWFLFINHALIWSCSVALAFIFLLFI